MSVVLSSDRYEKAPDALGMVDLMPQALGVEAAGIPLLLSKTFREKEKNGREQILYQDVKKRMNLEMGGQDVEAAGSNWSKIGFRTPGEEKQQPTVLFSGRPYAIPISGAFDTLARLTISLVAGLFLLVPMVVLIYIKKMEMRIIATCLSVLVFAIMLSVSSRARNQELVTATATYSVY